MKNLKRVGLSLVLVLLVAAVSGAAVAGEIVLTPDDGNGSVGGGAGQTIVIDLAPPPADIPGEVTPPMDPASPNVSNDINIAELGDGEGGTPADVIPPQSGTTPGSEPPAGNAAPSKSVRITTNVEGIVSVGDEITLFAVIEGYGDELIGQVWEYNDGIEWKAAQNGGNTYTFILNETNYRWDWRLTLIVAE